MWPFSSRCKGNKLSPGGPEAYRCSRQNGHVGAHTCTVTESEDWVKAGKQFWWEAVSWYKTHRWWDCVECGLSTDDPGRICTNCLKEPHLETTIRIARQA